MAWDRTRRVPWRRLLVEWAIVGAAMVLITLVFTDGDPGSTIGAIVLGGAIYMIIGALLAKLGYQRKSLRELRVESAAAAQQKAAAARSTTAARPRPAPTKRTSTGPSQRPRHQRKR